MFSERVAGPEAAKFYVEAAGARFGRLRFATIRSASTKSAELYHARPVDFDTLPARSSRQHEEWKTGRGLLIAESDQTTASPPRCSRRQRIGVSAGKTAIERLGFSCGTPRKAWVKLRSEWLRRGRLSGEGLYARGHEWRTGASSGCRSKARGEHSKLVKHGRRPASPAPAQHPTSAQRDPTSGESAGPPPPSLALKTGRERREGRRPADPAREGSARAPPRRCVRRA